MLLFIMLNAIHNFKVTLDEIYLIRAEAKSNGSKGCKVNNYIGFVLISFRYL